MIAPGLLDSACASIRLRLQREVLDETIPAGEAASLQEEILQDPLVRSILSTQSPAGWIGSHFHGYGGHEAGIRILVEKGLPLAHPCVQQAVQALEANGSRCCDELGTYGRVFDERNLGGTLMIQAATLAHAGSVNSPLVLQQIPVALDGFRWILSCSSIDGVCEPYRGKLVFRPGVSWASIYHLRLLAFTDSWRSPQNLHMLVDSIKRLVRLSPIPNIYGRHRSQVIAPASYAMLDFNPQMDALSSVDWVFWFHRMELLARLGVVPFIPELQTQVEYLEGLLESSSGWFALPLQSQYFRNWGSYTGLSLEPNWKSRARRLNDLTFRSLLIIHYSSLGGGS